MMMKGISKKLYPIFFFWAIVFVFCYFFAISRYTPLAGDDWGYALNGMKGNPFVTLIQFYMSWSGRIVSELWGLLVAPRKWLWNILNPLLFSIVFFNLNRLANKKRSR